MNAYSDPDENFEKMDKEIKSDIANDEKVLDWGQSAMEWIVRKEIQYIVYSKLLTIDDKISCNERFKSRKKLLKSN